MMSTSVSLHSRGDLGGDSLKLIEELKTVRINPEDHQVTKMGTTLSLEKEVEIIELLKNNVDLFAWHL